MHKILAAFLALFLLQAVCPAKDPPQITDDTISDAVRVKLAGDQVVGVLPLEVTVKQGVVTLAGSVDQKSLKSTGGEGRQEGQGREAGGQQHRDQDAHLGQMTRLRPTFLRCPRACAAGPRPGARRAEIRAPGARVPLHRRAGMVQGRRLPDLQRHSQRPPAQMGAGQRGRGLPHGCPRSRGQCLRRAGPPVHLRNPHAARHAHR